MNHELENEKKHIRREEAAIKSHFDIAQPEDSLKINSPKRKMLFEVWWSLDGVINLNFILDRLENDS